MKSFLHQLLILCALATSGHMASAGPEPTVKILINHLGYEPNAAKHAVILGHTNDEVTGFAILDASSGRTALSGPVAKVGPVAHWKDWVFWTADFGSVDAEGSYLIECNTSWMITAPCSPPRNCSRPRVACNTKPPPIDAHTA